MRQKVLAGFLLGSAVLVTGCAAWNRDELASSPHTVARLQVPVEVQSAETQWKAAVPDSTRIGKTQTASFQREDPKQPGKREPFDLPPDLPGAKLPPIAFPDLKDLTPAQREKALRAVYPPAPTLPEIPKGELPDTGKPYSLRDLQDLALRNNQAIRRASAAADAAYGVTIQAGLYPNPGVGWQADQIQPGSKPTNNSGQQGAFIQQLIKTAGKLSLAKAVAGMDYINAQVALRRAQVDVLTQLRSAWFDAIVAEETFKVARAIFDLSSEVYSLQIKLVAGGDHATYEPLQLYTQAVRSWTEFVEARNRYIAAHKRLGAALGDPLMTPKMLDGSAIIEPPIFGSDDGLQWVLEYHTDLLSARNSVLKSQYELRLAQVTPIPDIHTATVIQHDNSTSNNQANLMIGIQLPLFDRNQGNIRAARALLAEAIEVVKVRQNNLAAQYADAQARYQSNRTLVTNYREKVLPNLVRVYRSTYQRYQQEPLKVSFADIVVAQLNLGQAMRAYLQALSDQWHAVVEIGGLLQLDDLYQMPRDEPKK
jgi:cobalt-zinc-cadmium efflux system outer membrane protein